MNRVNLCYDEFAFCCYVCWLAGGNDIACVLSHKTLLFVIVTFCIMLDWVSCVIVTYYCVVKIYVYQSPYYVTLFLKKRYFRKLKFFFFTSLMNIVLQYVLMLYWNMSQLCVQYFCTRLHLFTHLSFLSNCKTTMSKKKTHAFTHIHACTCIHNIHTSIFLPSVVLFCAPRYIERKENSSFHKKCQKTYKTKRLGIYAGILISDIQISGLSLKGDLHVLYC